MQTGVARLRNGGQAPGRYESVYPCVSREAMASSVAVVLRHGVDLEVAAQVVDADVEGARVERGDRRA